MPSSRLIIPLVIVAAILLTFAPALRNGFVNYDDPFHIINNPRFSPPTLANATMYWRERGFFGLYIPLTYGAWTIVGQLAHRPRESSAIFNPTVFHAANVLIHIASALVVWAILRRTIARDWVAAAGALLFALHPLQVEAVAWISGFRDVFGGFLSLLTVWQYLRFAQAPPSRRPSAYAIVIVLFALALLAKPTAVVVPIIVFVIDLMIVRRPARVVGRAVVPLLAMSIVAAIWARAVQPSTLLPDRVSPFQRPLIAADAICFYLYKLIWPIHLGVDYGHAPRSVLDHGAARHACSVVVVMLLALVAMQRRIWALLRAAILIFVASLLPVLGLVPFDFQQFSTVADRYAYVAMLGVALAAAAALARIPPRIAVTCSVLILAALGAMSFGQTQTWRDSSTLFTHALRVNPGSWMAYTNLGMAARDPDIAEASFRRAIELNANHVEARLNLGAVLADRGEFEQAADQFQIAARLRPDIADAYANLGLAYYKLGRLDDAIAAYEKIPTDDRAKRMLARLRAAHPTTGP